MRSLLLVDTETSSLPEDPGARLVEIGAVWWSIDLGVVLATWSELVEGPSNEAIGINKIPVESLAYGLTRDQALDALRSRVVRADLVVCHNVAFDSFFLGDLGKPYLCSMSAFEWPGVDPGASVLRTAAGLEVPIVKQHRALTDCLLLADCFERVHAKEGAEGVRERLRRALRPRSRCVAQTTFAQKDITKKAGFRWNSDMKSWWKDVVDEEIGKLPFQVRRVPPGSAEYVGLAKG